MLVVSWILLQIYMFCCFDEVSAIRKPKIMTFSISGSQIFFSYLVIPIYVYFGLQFSMIYLQPMNIKVHVFIDQISSFQ